MPWMSKIHILSAILKSKDSQGLRSYSFYCRGEHKHSIIRYQNTLKHHDGISATQHTFKTDNLTEHRKYWKNASLHIGFQTLTLFPNEITLNLFDAEYS